MLTSTYFRLNRNKTVEKQTQHAVKSDSTCTEII